MTREQANALTAVVAKWVNARADLRGLAVCGSWARGNPRPDSDLDLIVLSSEPGLVADLATLGEIDFAAAGFRVTSVRHSIYGAAWSWHVQLYPSAELELTIAALSWAVADPIDDGTRAVVMDALRPVVDKERLFRDLLAKLCDSP